MEAPAIDEIRHPVGLQAQDHLAPYLGLAARLETFDPLEVTRGLEVRSLVRPLTMRGTVHLLAAEDALMLRRWTAPVHEREVRVSQRIGAARDVDRDSFRAAVDELLEGGPLPKKAIGAAAVLLDGMLEGLWRVQDGRVRILETFRSLSPTEQHELDAEIARVQALLSVPARGAGEQ